MYQSIPKRVYTQKESAMPKLPSSQSFFNEEQNHNKVSKAAKIPKLSKNLQTDDLLLIGLLLLLLSEEGDNDLLILVIAFLLFF